MQNSRISKKNDQRMTEKNNETIAEGIPEDYVERIVKKEPLKVNWEIFERMTHRIFREVAEKNPKKSYDKIEKNNRRIFQRNYQINYQKKSL